MTEWSVVLVIVTLAGLGAAIVKPIVSLTKSITTLTVVVEGLKEEMNHYRDKNSESHERIWKHEEKQDTQLDDHEKRLIKVEGK
ncbi:hypothetical protein SDC9_65953 [bioreactor metagenome]|uniref:Uncharacterized protein n=1 Tax=bioreactor metagenome TaxID=1076179 RepID=A0A644XUD6_9ZZZZ